MALLADLFKFPNLINHWGKWYSAQEYYELIKAGYIIDLRLGGLVLGPPHWRGGIFMYSYRGSLFECVGEMEGGEFVVNSAARELYQERLEQINQDYSNPTSLSEKATSASDTVRIVDNKRQALWLGHGNGVFIINKVSTAKHYEELYRINKLLDTNYSVAVNDDIEELNRYKRLDDEGILYDVIDKRQVWADIKRNTIRRMASRS